MFTVMVQKRILHSAPRMKFNSTIAKRMMMLGLFAKVDIIVHYYSL